MMSKLTLISFLLLMVITISCSDPSSTFDQPSEETDPVVQPDTIQSDIVDQWIWVQSTGGVAGHTITPDTEGYDHHSLTYTKEYLFSFHQADTLLAKGSYSFELENDEWIIIYESETEGFIPAHQIRFQGNDTLILIDQCTDCYMNTYVRN